MRTTGNPAGDGGLGSRLDRRRPRALLMVAGALALLTVLVGIGAVLASAELRHASSIVRYTTAGGQITVKAEEVGDFGEVLVIDKAYALYMFPPDRDRRVACTGDCASAWPPLLLPPGGRLVAGAGVKRSLLSADPDPGGGRVVTYAGWPLYTYLGDGVPRQAAGQAVDADGGYWYLMRPSGEIVGSSR